VLVMWSIPDDMTTGEEAVRFIIILIDLSFCYLIVFKASNQLYFTVYVCYILPSPELALESTSLASKSCPP
jgi:hypothetical protein